MFHPAMREFVDQSTIEVVKLRCRNTGSCRRLAAAAAVVLATGAPAAGLCAQSPVIQREVFVNSEVERYLRTLQVAGVVPLHPWSNRGFSPTEVDSLLPGNSGHPWADLHDWTPQPTGGVRAGWIAPRAELIYNSAFPMGNNDGAVWAGRGLTTVLQVGGSVRYGPLSLVLAPVAFRAENREFELASTGMADGPLVYANPALPKSIDLPQRFGDEPYARLDPGQSTLRLDLRSLALGVSTANLHWGPADQQPLLLGSNAPGFLHAFAGTSSPVGVGIGRLHARVLWGRIEQSDYTINPDSSAVRFATGMLAAFQPRGVPGLELGFARFFHMRWTDAQPGKVLETFLKRTLMDQETNPGGDDTDNQLASLFFRWVLPNAGIEVYGEYGREDHNWNFRDAVLQPDHSAAYVAGIRRTWMSSGGRLVSVGGELANAERSHLVEVRHQGRWYAHSSARQGHTHRGQVMGGTSLFGGRGSTVAADLYHPRGRWTVEWTRELRRPGAGWDDDEDPNGPDVTHEFGVEALRATRHFELTARLAAASNLNRNQSGDATNLQLTVGARARR